MTADTGASPGVVDRYAFSTRSRSVTMPTSLPSSTITSVPTFSRRKTSTASRNGVDGATLTSGYRTSAESGRVLERRPHVPARIAPACGLVGAAVTHNAAPRNAACAAASRAMRTRYGEQET